MRSASRWLQPNRCIGPGTRSRRCDGRLQHRLVQARVGDELLHLAVLLVELTPPQSGRTDVAESLAPHVAGHVADAQRGVLQCQRDLLVGERALPHDVLLAWSGLHLAGRRVVERGDMLGQGRFTGPSGAYDVLKAAVSFGSTKVTRLGDCWMEVS